MYIVIVFLLISYPFHINSFSRFFTFDYLTMIFLLLTVHVITFCFFSIFCTQPRERNMSDSITWICVMCLLILLRFMVNSYFLFYLLFELVFLIMLFYLFQFGVKLDREISAYYIFFFTLSLSLPLLIYIIISIESIKSTRFFRVGGWMGYWWLVIFLVFLVKVPIFGLHMWLPKAHVEASLPGSILLSGVLLKVGFYGIIRFLTLNKLFISSWSGYIITLGWGRALLVGAICLRQVDIKAIVAYSSIVHMGIALSRTLSNSSTSYEGSLYMCYAHGLRSPMMFYIVYIFYNRFNTRRMLLLKGGNSTHPLITFTCFLVILSSLGVPPLLSFFSEFITNIGVIMTNYSFVFISVILFFVSGVYMIYFFVYFSHGNTILTGIKSVHSPDLTVIYFMFFYMLFLLFILSNFSWTWHMQLVGLNKLVFDSKVYNPDFNLFHWVIEIVYLFQQQQWYYPRDHNFQDWIYRLHIISIPRFHFNGLPVMYPPCFFLHSDLYHLLHTKHFELPPFHLHSYDIHLVNVFNGAVWQLYCSYSRVGRPGFNLFLFGDLLREFSKSKIRYFNGSN
jgi:NADH-ubiquinone oxidoreductase chain 4